HFHHTYVGGRHYRRGNGPWSHGDRSAGGCEHLLLLDCHASSGHAPNRIALFLNSTIHRLSLLRSAYGPPFGGPFCFLRSIQTHAFVRVGSAAYTPVMP